MKFVLTAYKYLKRRALLFITALALMMLASFFDGASIGMLIPLIQSMTNTGATILDKIPAARGLSGFFSSMDRAHLISFILMVLFIMLAAKNLFTYLSNLLIARLRFGTARDLSVELVSNLIEYDLKFFDSIKAAQIINSVNNEMTRITEFMLAILNLVALTVRTATYVVILFLISWNASLVIFTMIGVVLLPLEIIVKRLKKISTRISGAYTDYNFKLTEIIGGIRLIKGSGTEEREKENFRASAAHVYDCQYAVGKNIYMLMPLSEVSIFGLIAVFFFILLSVIKIDITATFPFVAAYLFTLAKMLSQLNTLNNTRSAAQSNLPAFSNYEALIDASDKKTIKGGVKIIENFSDSIEFRGVDFSYVENKDVLKDINLRIPKGKVTAIVGISGVGKSTLVNLILRFYDIRKGSITADGIDLKELDLKGWRKKIGFVSQDIFIFNAAVKDNIGYGHPDARDKEIYDAAKAAGAHDFIMNLPNKYETILGERGVRLSGGQKQRISIARAIIDNPEILILDEATSSLDTETERLIKNAINDLTKNRTVIAIAHRLSTIVHADNIVVLDKGRIAENGSHAELLNRNGAYKRLYDVQFNV